MKCIFPNSDANFPAHSAEIIIWCFCFAEQSGSIAAKLETLVFTLLFVTLIALPVSVRRVHCSQRGGCVLCKGVYKRARNPMGVLRRTPRATQREEDPSEASAQEPSHKLHSDTCAQTALFFLCTPSLWTIYFSLQQCVCVCVCACVSDWVSEWSEGFDGLPSDKLFLLSADHKKRLFSDCSTIYQRHFYVCILRTFQRGSAQHATAASWKVSVWTSFSDSSLLDWSWGTNACIYRGTQHGTNSCSKCLYIHSQRFVFLWVIKDLFLCERKLGHFELSVCFQTSQSMASSLHVKEWLNGWREEDKQECLFFIPQASCLLAPRGALEPKERWLLGYRWAVGIQEWSRFHCEQQPGESKIEESKDRGMVKRWNIFGGKEGRGEENGMTADVSLSACSQNINGRRKQNCWDRGQECGGGCHCRFFKGRR